MDALNEFEDLPAAVTMIDLLVYEAARLKGREKKSKLKEAQRIADAYEQHCVAGGNNVKQFKPFL